MCESVMGGLGPVCLCTTKLQKNHKAAAKSEAFIQLHGWSLSVQCTCNFSPHLEDMFSYIL